MEGEMHRDRRMRVSAPSAGKASHRALGCCIVFVASRHVSHVKISLLHTLCLFLSLCRCLSLCLCLCLALSLALSLSLRAVTRHARASYSTLPSLHPRLLFPATPTRLLEPAYLDVLCDLGLVHNTCLDERLTHQRPHVRRRIRRHRRGCS